MTNSEKPLVSVGVPTYNRPEGVRRTLSQICSQTYRNIEILVSDNASPTDDTSNVVKEFQASDHRIEYIRQTENKGPAENFRFVLRKARGEFFMWAADDDEWDSRFIEACLDKIESAGSAMSFHRTHFRATGQIVEERAPLLAEANGPYANASAFIEVLDAVLFYGVHRTRTIQQFLSDPTFDFYDCFFVFRQVIENGVVTIPEWLFASGVDAVEYQPKPFKPLSGRRYQYLPFFTACAKAILRGNRLGLLEKGMLLNEVAQKTLEVFCWHEKAFQPRKVKFAGSVGRVLSGIERLVRRRFPV